MKLLIIKNMLVLSRIFFLFAHKALFITIFYHSVFNDVFQFGMLEKDLYSISFLSDLPWPALFCWFTLMITTKDTWPIQVPYFYKSLSSKWLARLHSSKCQIRLWCKKPHWKKDFFCSPIPIIELLCYETKRQHTTHLIILPLL
jgi:hypothetical protein